MGDEIPRQYLVFPKSKIYHWSKFQYWGGNHGWGKKKETILLPLCGSAGSWVRIDSGSWSPQGDTCLDVSITENVPKGRRLCKRCIKAGVVEPEEKMEYRYEVRVKFPSRFLIKIRNSMERMCDLPWFKFSKETCTVLDITNRDRPPYCSIFDIFIEKHQDANIIGQAAGYTYQQLYHAKHVIELVLENQKELTEYVESFYKEHIEETIRVGEQVRDVLGQILLEMSGVTEDKEKILQIWREESEDGLF